MNIIVYSSTGHMGQILCDLIENGSDNYSIAARVSRRYTEDSPDGYYSELGGFTGKADCLIDFSNHEAIGEIAEYCISRNLPMVIATTGHTPEELEIIRNAASSIPVFHSANMSVGVALLCKLVSEAVGMFPDADVEIIEKHHNRKLDAPSGTALMIAKSIQEVRTEATLNLGRSGSAKRAKEEIGIHAVRIGNEVGTHEVLISNGNETITLRHEAENRALFAQGALKAASFLVEQKPGYYTMKDLVG